MSHKLIKLAASSARRQQNSGSGVAFANNTAGFVTNLADRGADLNGMYNSLSNSLSTGAVLSGIDGAAVMGAMALEMGTPMGMWAIDKTGRGMEYAGGKVGAPNLGKSVRGTHSYLDHKLNAQLKDRGWGRKLAGATDTVMSGFYTATSKLNDWTGLFSDIGLRYERKALKNGNLAAAHVEKIGASLPSELQGLLSGLVTTAKNHDAEGYKQAVGAIQENKTLLKTPRPIQRIFRRVQKLTGNQLAALEKSVGYKDLAAGRHNTLEKASNVTVKSGIANTLWATTSIASTAVTAKDLISDIDTFRNLVADIKGIEKEEVTSGDALFGDLPYVGNLARRSLLMTAPPRAVFEGINQVFNINMIRGKHPNLLFILLPILGSQAIGQFTSGNLLDIYKEMKEIEEKGEPNDAEHYAKLIGIAHKGLHSRDGGNSSFAKEIGRIYAERQVSIRETLADAQNGKIDQLIYHIQHENMELENGADTLPTTPTAMLSEVESVRPNTTHYHEAEKVANDDTEIPLESFTQRVKQPDTPTETAR